MSSFEKVVKNACKPKPTPPKSKVSSPLSGVHTSSHNPSPLSTSTQSSPLPGPRMAPSMMSVEPFPLASESQTLLSVCLCNRMDGGRASRLTNCPGCVQGTHCPSHDGSEWCDGQCTPILVLFGCLTIKKRCRWSMGRCALYFSPFATLTHCVQATMLPRVSSITPYTLTRAYAPTVT